MLRVGLTGGIGAGKSEVARRLAGHGALVIDADELAREAVAPGSPGLAEVVAEFGPEVLRSDGTLDRDRVGAIVFADPGARARLNRIVHPRVGTATAQRLAAAAPDAIVVLDIPLLVETGMATAFDVLLVVAAEPATQLRRLIERRGLTPAEAQARIDAQAPLAEKLAVADQVIWNEGDLAALDERVAEVWADLVARADRATAP